MLFGVMLIYSPYLSVLTALYVIAIIEGITILYMASKMNKPY